MILLLLTNYKSSLNKSAFTFQNQSNLKAFYKYFVSAEFVIRYKIRLFRPNPDAFPNEFFNFERHALGSGLANKSGVDFEDFHFN